MKDLPALDIRSEERKWSERKLVGDPPVMPEPMTDPWFMACIR